MKINLQKITFCIPVRIDSIYRLENLYTVLYWINSSFDTNFLIIEGDNEQVLKKLPEIQTLKYQFIRDNDPIFHRTKYINMMLHEISTPYAAIWDTDAITYFKQIRTAYNIICDGFHTLVYPYNGTFYNLSEILSALFKKNFDFKILNQKNHSIPLLNGYYAVGGAYMVNVANYLKAGGENENFYGWGPEDVERKIRMEILNEPIKRVTGPLFHLYHPRGINSMASNKELAINNIKELCNICKREKDSLLKYINSWHWR